MSEKIWSAVDEYVAGKLIGDDPPLENALAASAAAGLPSIQVSPAQGKFLFLLARLVGARRILEIGTLGGYSTIWLARGLSSGGSLVTLEIDPHHAAVAQANLAAAGLGERVDIRVGPALTSLASIAAERREPFDLVFIDADKPATPEYFQASIALCRPGSVILVDNVVRGGALIDDKSDANAAAMRRLHDMISSDARVSATTIQTVGSKGYDGFTMAVVEGEGAEGL